MSRFVVIKNAVELQQNIEVRSYVKVDRIGVFIYWKYRNLLDDNRAECLSAISKYETSNRQGLILQLQGRIVPHFPPLIK